MRPTSIIRFEWLYIAKIILGVVAGLLALSTLHQNGVDLGPMATPTVLGVGVVIGIGIDLLLLFFAARKASDVARWIIVVFFGFSCIGTVMGLVRGTALATTGSTLSLLVFVITAVCVWYLFRPDANAWFKKRLPPADLNQTF